MIIVLIYFKIIFKWNIICFILFKKNPLDSTILNKLKPVVIKDENQKSKIEYNCVICWEKYKLRNKYIKLPCKHIFHEHCIKFLK